MHLNNPLFSRADIVIRDNRKWPQKRGHWVVFLKEKEKRKKKDPTIKQTALVFPQQREHIYTVPHNAQIALNTIPPTLQIMQVSKKVSGQR